MKFEIDNIKEESKNIIMGNCGICIYNGSGLMERRILYSEITEFNIEQNNMLTQPYTDYFGEQSTYKVLIQIESDQPLLLSRISRSYLEVMLFILNFNLNTFKL